MDIVPENRFGAFFIEVIMFDNPVEETTFYTDDTKWVHDLVKEEWALPFEEPTFKYLTESSMMDSRRGSIFFYPVSRNNAISSTDYSTIRRISYISIKINTRFRDVLYDWAQEIYRIMLANRRRGNSDSNGYTFLEVVSDREQTDLTGWYTTTIDIKLTRLYKPIKSAGFGNKINRQITDSQQNFEGTL